MRKVILYIAMSLDGYIADQQGSVDWLVGDQTYSLEESSYDRFIQGIDTVLLGYKTYHQIANELAVDQWPYAQMDSYVLTHRHIANQEHIFFTDQAIETLIHTLKQKDGKDIWICGGAQLVNQLIQKNLIDCYWITVIPTLLGSGISLFQDNHSELKLKLISSKSYSGMTDLIYERR